MSQDALNPDWTEAIKKAMHKSIVNAENIDPSPDASPVFDRPPTPLPKLNLSPKPFSLSHAVNNQVRKSPSVSSDSEVDARSYSTRGSRHSVASRGSRSSSSNESSRSDRVRSRRQRHRRDQTREKYELLARLQHLESEKGYKSFRSLTAEDSIHDVRYEFFRAQREVTKKVNVKLMQKYLVTFTSVVEMVAEWYNPFNLKLSGYSKSVLLTMKDYEPILEELHYKYSDSVSVGPELKLVMALASSIFFYHTGKNLSYECREPEPSSEPSSQGTMHGPRLKRPVGVPQFPDPQAAMNPLSMMMPSTGLVNPLGAMNIRDIMSGLSMVQTLMNNPK